MCITINTPKGHACCVARHVGGRWIAHQWHNGMAGTVIAIPSYSIQNDCEVQMITYHSIKNWLVNNKPWKLNDWKSHRHHHWLIIAKVQKKIWKLFSIVLRGRLRLKCDGTSAGTRFCLLAKWTSPFKSVGASVQSTTGSLGVRISSSNAGCTMFRGSVKSTGYPLHSPVSPSLPILCTTVCHHVSNGLYKINISQP